MNNVTLHKPLGYDRMLSLKKFKKQIIVHNLTQSGSLLTELRHWPLGLAKTFLALKDEENNLVYNFV